MVIASKTNVEEISRSNATFLSMNSSGLLTLPISKSQLRFPYAGLHSSHLNRHRHDQSNVTEYLWDDLSGIRHMSYKTTNSLRLLNNNF